MSELLQEIVQEKRQNLIDRLIQLGVYKINNKHLYEMSLSELEEEYFVLQNSSDEQPAVPVYT